MTPDTNPTQAVATAIKHQVERSRRASVVWQRHRMALMRLLVESMEEFEISQAELAKARRARLKRFEGKT